MTARRTGPGAVSHIRAEKHPISTPQPGRKPPTSLAATHQAASPATQPDAQAHWKL